MTTSRPYAWCIALLALLGPAAAEAQQPPTVLDSYRRARALVDTGIAAHGGRDALRDAEKIRVVLEGHDIHRNQSRRVASPYDTTWRWSTVMIDLARDQVVSREARGYPGGFRYNTGFITDGSRSFSLDTRNRTYSEQRYPPAREQHGQLFTVPQWYLRAASEMAAPGSLRSLGTMRTGSGVPVDAVAITLREGWLLTLGFDPASHRLRSVMGVGTDIFTGDTEVETEFLDYRTLNGVLLPTRRVLRRGGEVIRVETYTDATRGYDIPDSLLAPPADYTASPPAPSDSVRELAPGVWAIRHGYSWSLAVGFADHVLVVDAPPNAARGVIAHVATLAPGKPIRYVVPTHHHDDHFGGVRAYAAAGAITITTPGNLEYFRRTVSAPPTTLQANAPPATPRAQAEAITGRRRVFGDGSRTVEIHDIGPNPHADEMLVAWLPAEGILFHADLIEAPPNGVAMRGTNAEATIHFAEWVKKKGWNPRVIAGAHSILAGPAELERIVRQPIFPR